METREEKRPTRCGMCEICMQKALDRQRKSAAGDTYKYKGPLRETAA